MLAIKAVNHIGIRVKQKSRSIDFYTSLGFEFTTDAGFEEGHPIIMKHPGGVVINLLGPSTMPENENILMDVSEKYTGITHFALTINSIDEAKMFLEEKGIAITGSFSFGGMSAIFVRDPDRNVIELDAYGSEEQDDMSEYSGHL